MNTPISTLLEQKGGVVHSVGMTATVAEAVREMVRHRVGAVLVMDGAKIAGIFTERDVLRRVVGQDLEPRNIPVTQVMTADVLVAGPTATVQQMMELFAEKRCRHMPVVQDGRLLGMISIGDVSRWVASAHRAEAESLRQYITGGLSG
jgi:CBS domain-containing protein